MLGYHETFLFISLFYIYLFISLTKPFLILTLLCIMKNISGSYYTLVCQEVLYRELRV